MMLNSLNDVKSIAVPTIVDPDGRGNLSVIEDGVLPFQMQRVYYIYDIPTNSYRGAHAHKAQQEFLIALSGSFDVVLDDGADKKRYRLNDPKEGLLIPTGIWRELENFSSGSVCMVLNSSAYEEEDYIRDYSTFKQLKSQ